MSATAVRRICMIPAKGASTRLPRKNILPLGGHPLLAHAIMKARRIEGIERVAVSTEDAEIAEIAQRYGGDVPFMRPAELSVDPATIADVLVHMLDWYRDERGETYDQYVLLLPTSPLVLVADVRAAIEDFERHGGVGCLLSVSPTEHPPFTTQLLTDEGYLRPAVPESPYRHKKSTECPPAYHSNGCVCVGDADWLREHHSFYGPETRGFVMERLRAVDIDTAEDYALAKALFEIDWIEKEKDLFT